VPQRSCIIQLVNLQWCYDCGNTFGLKSKTWVCEIKYPNRLYKSTNGRIKKLYYTILSNSEVMSKMQPPLQGVSASEELCNKEVAGVAKSMQGTMNWCCRQATIHLSKGVHKQVLIGNQSDLQMLPCPAPARAS